MAREFGIPSRVAAKIEAHSQEQIDLRQPSNKKSMLAELAKSGCEQPDQLLSQVLKQLGKPKKVHGYRLTTVPQPGLPMTELTYRDNVVLADKPWYQDFQKETRSLLPLGFFQRSAGHFIRRGGPNQTASAESRVMQAYLSKQLLHMLNQGNLSSHDQRERFISSGQYFANLEFEGEKYPLQLMQTLHALKSKPVKDQIAFITLFTSAARGVVSDGFGHDQCGAASTSMMKVSLENTRWQLHEAQDANALQRHDQMLDTFVKRCVFNQCMKTFDHFFDRYEASNENVGSYQQARTQFLENPHLLDDLVSRKVISINSVVTAIKNDIVTECRQPGSLLPAAIENANNSTLRNGNLVRDESSPLFDLCLVQEPNLAGSIFLKKESIQQYLMDLNILEKSNSSLFSVFQRSGLNEESKYSTDVIDFLSSIYALGDAERSDHAQWKTVATDLAFGMLFGTFKPGADLKARAGFKTVSLSFLRTFLEHEPKVLTEMLITLDSKKLDNLVDALIQKKDRLSIYSLMAHSIEEDATHVLSHLIKDGKLLALDLDDSEMKNALKKGRTACLDLFLKAGYNINSIFDNQTMLATAATLGLEDEAYLLLKNSASPSIQDRETAKQPLHLAIEKENEAIALMLLSKNAPVGLADKSGKTPIDYAIESQSSQLFDASLGQLKAEDGQLTYSQARKIVFSGSMNRIKTMQSLFPSSFLVRQGLNANIAFVEYLSSWISARPRG